MKTGKTLMPSTSTKSKKETFVLDGFGADPTDETVAKIRSRIFYAMDHPFQWTVKQSDLGGTEDSGEETGVRHRAIFLRLFRGFDVRVDFVVPDGDAADLLRTPLTRRYCMGFLTGGRSGKTAAEAMLEVAPYLTPTVGVAMLIATRSVKLSTTMWTEAQVEAAAAHWAAILVQSSGAPDGCMYVTGNRDGSAFHC